MPSFDNEPADAPQLVAFENALDEALRHAQNVKPTPSIEPALAKADFAAFLSQLSPIFSVTSSSEAATKEEQTRKYLTIETAIRRRLDTLLAALRIDTAEFVEVWNLLDLTIALAESDQCDTSLPFSLIEELIDSQTIEACRTVFDYLESRRERLVREWGIGKSLVILRTCNELLRRLSRAEDISFSGRVFIFMFQSFPMNDKGTLNLRGIYHTENVTIWEDIPPKQELQEDAAAAADKMEVDSKEEEALKPATTQAAKAVTFDAKGKPAPEKPLDTDALYPIFWSLQNYFSQPTKLFDADNMSKFKSSLEATVTAFESVAQGQENSKAADDAKNASKKRKRFDVNATDSSNFNPKYLTSRDLFELEMSDLFFRRHILIQAIIVLDFLKSLTASAKARHQNIQHPNKSVMYHDHVTTDDDDKWAETMRRRIYEYIMAGPDGQYVHRIIQAVTQRDKGWSRWKMETCPPIERPAVTPDEFNEARASAKRMATSKRLRPHPMGSLSLDFLKVEDEETAMEKFKEPSRWKLPDLATFKEKIDADDTELDFAKTEKEKATILEAKASKTWRALRIASRRRLAAFDKVEDWQDIKAVFEDPKESGLEGENEDEGEIGRQPEDKSPIIISGPPGVGKSTLVSMLRERQPRVFQKLVQHTTRKPRETEINGRDYQFVDAPTFNRMSDNDQLIEITERKDFSTGTSKKAADSIKESGKVPLLEMDRQSVLSCKDWGYDARVILLIPPNIEELEVRLAKAGPAEDVKSVLTAAQEELDQSTADASSYGRIITNGDLETAYRELEEFVYGSATETNGINGDSATNDGDVTMVGDDSNVSADIDGAAKTSEVNGD